MWKYEVYRQAATQALRNKHLRILLNELRGDDMKQRQGAEIPDALLFKEVATCNQLSSVTIISKAELETLCDRRLIDTWFKSIPLFDRRRRG